MLNLETIEAEILALEKRDTTYAAVERLAWLYIVRDHLTESREPERYGGGGASDFLHAAHGCPIDSILQVVDEHMEAVRVIYPAEYSAIVERIKRL